MRFLQYATTSHNGTNRALKIMRPLAMADPIADVGLIPVARSDRVGWVERQGNPSTKHCGAMVLASLNPSYETGQPLTARTRLRPTFTSKAFLYSVLFIG
jgi:hypothetical protein